MLTGPPDSQAVVLFVLRGMATWQERRARELAERRQWTRIPREQQRLILAALNGRPPVATILPTQPRQLELWRGRDF
jgi:hypothetical protein